MTISWNMVFGEYSYEIVKWIFVVGKFQFSYGQILPEFEIFFLIFLQSNYCFIKIIYHIRLNMNNNAKYEILFNLISGNKAKKT